MFFIKSKGKYYAFSEDSKIITNANYSEKEKSKEKKNTTYYILNSMKNGALAGAGLRLVGGTAVGTTKALTPSYGTAFKAVFTKGDNAPSFIAKNIGSGAKNGTLYGAVIGGGLGALNGYLKSIKPEDEKSKKNKK